MTQLDKVALRTADWLIRTSLGTPLNSRGF